MFRFRIIYMDIIEEFKPTQKSLFCMYLGFGVMLW